MLLVQPPLKRADRLAQGGLRYTELGGGSGEAAGTSHRGEGRQFIKTRH
jgi:hypothetical protein